MLKYFKCPFGTFMCPTGIKNRIFWKHDHKGQHWLAVLQQNTSLFLSRDNANCSFRCQVSFLLVSFWEFNKGDGRTKEKASSFLNTMIP